MMRRRAIMCCSGRGAVERFPSVTAFVETHLALVATLDAEQDKLQIFLHALARKRLR